jgi:hypothetical protein
LEIAEQFSSTEGILPATPASGRLATLEPGKLPWTVWGEIFRTGGGLIRNDLRGESNIVPLKWVD